MLIWPRHIASWINLQSHCAKAHGVYRVDIKCPPPQKKARGLFVAQKIKILA